MTTGTEHRLPDLSDVRAASARIAPHVNRTPLFTSRTLDLELNAEIVFKSENLQKVGAFKARGAVNAVLCLDDEAAARGVATHSSGNHAAALAYAASIRRLPCTVVMPETSNPIKVKAVVGYGAEVVFCPPGERESTCARVLEETGATFIHPFENPNVIAGQGTAALEMLEENPDLDFVVAPVGGGGLLAGTSITVKTLRPRAEVIGAEPEAVDDAYRSLASGERQPAVPHPRTLADGLLTGLGEINFEILREREARVVTVTEEAIREAALFHLQRMKLVVEPSAATGLAALRVLGEEIEGRRVGVILSGGNTDFHWLSD
jgi:threonine dehydratase